MFDVSWPQWLPAAAGTLIYEVWHLAANDSWVQLPALTTRERKVTIHRADAVQLPNPYADVLIRVRAVAEAGQVLSETPAAVLPGVKQVFGPLLDVLVAGSTLQANWSRLASDFVSAMAGVRCLPVDRTGQPLAPEVVLPASAQSCTVSSTAAQAASHLRLELVPAQPEHEYLHGLLPLNPVCRRRIDCTERPLVLLARHAQVFDLRIDGSSFKPLEPGASMVLQWTCNTQQLAYETLPAGQVHLRNGNLELRALRLPYAAQTCSVTFLGYSANQTLLTSELQLTTAEFVDAAHLPQPKPTNLNDHLETGTPLHIEWLPLVAYGGSANVVAYELVAGYGSAQPQSLYYGLSTAVLVDSSSVLDIRYVAILRNGTAVASAAWTAPASARPANSSSSSGAAIPLVALVVVLVLVVAILSLLLILAKRHGRQRSIAKDLQVDSELLQTMHATLARMHSKEDRMPREIDISSITIHTPLGEGKFGQVHK